MKKSQKINGFTLVEMSATIVVIGIIGLGLIMTLRTTFLHYSTDYVRQEIRQYGNIVMRELNEKINNAQQVSFGVHQNGFALIQIWNGSSNPVPSETIRANSDEGILINNSPLMGGTFQLPTVGRFRDNDQHRVSLIDFTWSQETDPRPSLNNFNNNMITIALTIQLDSDVLTDEETVAEEFYFSKSVFVANNYIQTL